MDTDFFTPDSAGPSSHFLVVSALVPYKRLDVAIEAATRLGVPLDIVGTGPDLGRLQARAGTGIRFLGSVEGEALRELYRRARALVLPAEEDFGIAPVEAMACGRPVVAYGRGGVLETVIPGVTGVLAETQTADAFSDAMSRLDGLAFDPGVIRSHAEQFSRTAFEDGFAASVRSLLAEAA